MATIEELKRTITFIRKDIQTQQPPSKPIVQPTAPTPPSAPSRVVTIADVLTGQVTPSAVGQPVPPSPAVVVQPVVSEPSPILPPTTPSKITLTDVLKGQAPPGAIGQPIPPTVMPSLPPPVVPSRRPSPMGEIGRPMDITQFSKTLGFITQQPSELIEERIRSPAFRHFYKETAPVRATAQDVTQQTYQDLIQQDFEIVGMTRDETGNWVVDEQAVGALKQIGYTVTITPEGLVTITPPESYRQQAIAAGQQYYTTAAAPYQELYQPEIMRENWERMTDSEKIKHMKQYGRFDGKSWGEYQQEHPDMYLVIRNGEPVMTNPSSDIGLLYDWVSEQYGKNLVADIARAVSISVLSVFRPETWTSLASGGGGLDVAPVRGAKKAMEETWKWEYKLSEMQGLEKFVALQAPAYENVILPLIFGGILRVASAGEKATGVLKTVYKTAKTISMGTAAVGIGVSMGYTAAVQPEKLSQELAKLGLQISLMGVGAQASWKVLSKEYIISPEYPGVVGRRLYIDVFGKQVYVGKPKLGFMPGFEPGVKPGLVPIHPIGGRQPLGFLPGYAPLPVGPAIVSISQIAGVKKITYDAASGKFIVEKIISKKTTPLGAPFKVPMKTVKTPEEILFGEKFEKDLFKIAESITVQKKLFDFMKGSYLVEKDISIQLEEIPVLKGIKPFIRPISEKKPVSDISKWRATKEEELRWDKQQADAIKALENWKTYTLQDVIKKGYVQTKLFQEKISMVGMKPFTGFKPPEKHVRTWEDIFTRQSRELQKQFLRQGLKPMIKPTKQISLDFLFKPSVDVLKVALYTRPMSKTLFRYKPETMVKEKPVVAGKTETIQIEEKPSSIWGYEVEGMPGKISMEELIRVGRFEVDEYVRMRHPMAPVGKTIPVSKGMLLVGLHMGEQIKTEENNLIDIMKDIDLSSKVEQGRMQLLFRGELVKDVSENMFKQIYSQQQHMIQGSVQLQSQIQGQMQLQVQLQAQVQASIMRQVSKLDIVPEVIPVSPKLFLGLPELVGIFGTSTQPQSFHVEAKNRQYVRGKRVYPTSFRRITKHPFSEFDARAVGADFVGKNEKATFRLVPSEDKPRKLPKKIKSWPEVMFQFDCKPDGRIVEKTRYRIDSPGELEAITFEGIKARRRR